MDGDLDLFIANQYDLSSTPWIGKIYFFRNVGTNLSPIYEEEYTSLTPLSVKDFIHSGESLLSAGIR